jgi:hypothetical protein
VHIDLFIYFFRAIPSRDCASLSRYDTSQRMQLKNSLTGLEHRETIMCTTEASNALFARSSLGDAV